MCDTGKPALVWKEWPSQLLSTHQWWTPKGKNQQFPTLSILWGGVKCVYGFSVSALWCLLATPTILLGFLLPWAWGISSRLHQQSTAAAPYLGWRVSPRTALPDLQRGGAPLGPPALAQPPLLGPGVAPLGRRPWPRTLGSSRPHLVHWPAAAACA